MLFPELQPFLLESRARLMATVGSIPPGQMARRPAPERWSPLEVIEHLALGEEWYLQIVTDLVANGRRQSLCYEAGAPRDVDAVTALAAQIDIRQPQAAPPFAWPTGSVLLPALLDRLSRSRRGLLDLLPALAELDTDRLKFRHPTLRFELNACQWIHLSGLHDRMHGRQIRNALEGP